VDRKDPYLSRHPFDLTPALNKLFPFVTRMIFTGALWHEVRVVIGFARLHRVQSDLMVKLQRNVHLNNVDINTLR